MTKYDIVKLVEKVRAVGQEKMDDFFSVVDTDSFIRKVIQHEVKETHPSLIEEARERLEDELIELITVDKPIIQINYSKHMRED